MRTREWYRTVIEIEMLSDAPLGPLDLEQIAYEITRGSCSGKLRTTVDNEETDGPTMARLLLAQDSDPEFLGLSDDGRALDAD